MTGGTGPAPARELPNTCPHCGASPCLSVWRKLTLGPSAKLACPVCGFRVTVAPAQAWTALAIPLVALALASFHLIDFPTALLVVPVTLVVAAVLYVQWVPLTRWDISNAAAVAQGVARRAAEARGHAAPATTDKSAMP